MRIEFISDEQDDKISFVIQGINATFANALRRVIMSEVPIYACNEVIFYKNSSPLYDEIISHRVGLIPLKTPPDADEDSKMVTISLETVGPSTVLSSEFVSDDSEVKPINGEFPLVKLGPGQELVFNAECTVGYGRDHVRWQAGLASYKNYPTIIIEKDLCNLCKECIKACPVNILKTEGDMIQSTDDTKCTYCRACIEACKKLNEQDIIKVIPQSDKFIFNVESFGNMSAKDLLKSALRVIENKVKSFDQQMSV